jgi:serine/threonine protein kinase
VLSGFTYVRPLGVGGFADVFLFEQNMPRRGVAIKVLIKDMVTPGVLRMFNAEADMLAQLSAHPSIVTIYGASISPDGRPYIAMEYCPRSLTNRYRSEQISVPEVLTIGVKIASALETAHRAKLLHRDIKPSNILITQFGIPVLSDFGIAIAATRNTMADENFAMSLLWSAPEVLEKRVTGSVPSEVWSLGATLYTLLAGRSPFERRSTGRGQNSREQVTERIVKAHYTPLDRPDVPRSLQTLLATSMQRDPAMRCTSAGEFGYALQQVQYQAGLPYTPLEVPQNEWAALGQPFIYDDRMRGPVHSRVPYETTRVPRQTPQLPNNLDDAAFPGAQRPARLWRRLHRTTTETR